ncbi:hypothetical protein [uncultured Caulobacter sp.]|uniref:hypothetical protein n=1 Tax=uncultured Caulobacter sp. TaxID=158749 RepID=UPI00262F1264|nr:hypothetical protein [uncultured Caulobacter sp.]
MTPRRGALPALVALALAGPALAGDPGTLQEHDTFRDAATAPLEDLNLKRKTIPPVLQRAVDNPYDLTGLTRCEPIAAEIGKLDAALGPDLDEAPPPDQRSRGKKVADAAYGAGVAEVRDTTQHVLPFRGWIRRLTGAAKHDRAVAKAIQSGGVRRGYLKGVGMRMNCAPPAAPSWFVPVETKPVPPPKATGVVEAFLAWWRDLLAWLKGLIKLGA